MNHFRLVETADADGILEFSHFDYDAPAGLWKKEAVIIRDCIKLNVFAQGSFSVFSDGLLHQPIYGDVCFLPPMKMHYGQVKKPLRIEYFQLDVGARAFSGVPGGDALLGRLMAATAEKDSFLRPDAQSKETVLRLCGEVERAIQKKELALAFGKVIELFSFLDTLYRRSENRTGVAYSLRTVQVVRYVEEHFAEDVSMKQIAESLGVSASFLSRAFKKEIGVTIHEYLNRYRVLRAVELLKTHSVTESGYLCGFSDTSHFISVFKKHMNTTPKRYQTLIQ